MAMMHPADDLNFGSKLPLALTSAQVQLLHGHNCPVRQRSFIHTAKPTLAEKVVLGEIIGRSLQFAVCEVRPGVAHFVGSIWGRRYVRTIDTTRMNSPRIRSVTFILRTGKWHSSTRTFKRQSIRVYVSPSLPATTNQKTDYDDKGRNSPSSPTYNQ